MLERQDCECSLEAEHDHGDNPEAQDAAEEFSPRDHQAGFWS
jgi:hypothetical protein